MAGVIKMMIPINLGAPIFGLTRENLIFKVICTQNNLLKIKAHCLVGLTCKFGYYRVN